jgi:gluconolactonase
MQRPHWNPRLLCALVLTAVSALACGKAMSPSVAGSPGAGPEGMTADAREGAPTEPDARVATPGNPAPDTDASATDAGGPAPANDAGVATGTRPAVPVCPPGPFEAPKPGPAVAICPGFPLRFGWNEGPAWAARQNAFFFSNFTKSSWTPPGDLIKYDVTTGKCEVFLEGNGCNGLVVDHQGYLLAVCQVPRAVLRYDLDTKKSTVVVDMVEGKKLDTPNDIVIHRNGTIYFSNTTWDNAGRDVGLGFALLRIDPLGVVSIIARGSINPLALSPDDKRLYAMGGYWDLDADGVPLQKHTPFTLGADGVGVDCAGNVYTMNGAIVSPDNKTIGRFAAGTNMAFGGADGKTLLAVGGRGMHTIQMNLPGLP